MAGLSQIDIEILKKRDILLTYILNNAANKIPIQYTDIYDFFDKQKTLVSELIPMATEALKDFGIIMKEVPEQKSKKIFICFADDTAQSSLEFNEEQKRHVCLIFVILSYIFMKGGVVYEEQLEIFLKGIDIHYDEPHSYFGPNIKKLITETFVRQLYLKREKSDSEFDTETKFLFKWGYRAKMEFRAIDLLLATAGIMNKNPTDFLAQYDDAMANDDEAMSDDD